MDQFLSFAEARVFGCLLEKEKTTPEYYPLTLNALVAAANQKSSRDPVVDFDDETVQLATDGLREKGLVYRVDVAGSRVPKFRHSLERLVELPPEEKALLCVLLLRGPQTPGELRSRTERMFSFASLDAVTEGLQSLAGDYTIPLVRVLPRQPGRKEARWVQLLTGEPDAELLAEREDVTASPRGPEGTPVRFVREEDWVALRAEVAELRQDLEQSQQEIAHLRHLVDQLKPLLE